MNFIKANKKRVTQSIENIQIENRKDDSLFTGDEIEAKLDKAIATLPDKQKLVFNLKYFDDLKYKEIAEILGGAIKPFKKHLSKKQNT